MHDYSRCGEVEKPRACERKIHAILPSLHMIHRT